MTMDFNERMIPGVSAQFLYWEAVARYEFASKFVKSGAKALDAATGTGYGADILSKNKSISIKAQDISREAIAYCKKNYKNKKIKFIVADITKFSDKNKYDFITAMEIIEHLPRGNDFLKRAYRALNKGGILVVSTPNSRIVESSNLPRSPYHKKEYGLQEFVKLFRQAEFKKVQIYGQKKNKKAKFAFKRFLQSQNVRQATVDRDILGIRKLVPAKHKEFVWKFVARFFGGQAQYDLSAGDFPVKKFAKNELENCEYFVAVAYK